MEYAEAFRKDAAGANELKRQALSEEWRHDQQ